MSRQESNHRGSEQYQPIPKLLQNLNARLKIAPWDQLDLKSLGEERIRHVAPQQLAPKEWGVDAIHRHESTSNFIPIDNYRRGYLSGIDVHTGTVEFYVPNEARVKEAVIIQHVHNPKEQHDEQGNLLIYNDWVVPMF